MEQSYTVWLCDACRIASFHPVEGYREQHFFRPPILSELFAATAKSGLSISIASKAMIKTVIALLLSIIYQKSAATAALFVYVMIQIVR